MLLPQDLELLGHDLAAATKQAIAKALAPYELRARELEVKLAAALARIEGLEQAQRRSMKSSGVIDWPKARSA